MDYSYRLLCFGAHFRSNHNPFPTRQLSSVGDLMWGVYSKPLRAVMRPHLCVECVPCERTAHSLALPDGSLSLQSRRPRKFQNHSTHDGRNVCFLDFAAVVSDRLGRSLSHLTSRREGLLSNPYRRPSIQVRLGADLQFHMMGARAEFERSLISERTKAKMTAARIRGVRLGRPDKKKLSAS